MNWGSQTLGEAAAERRLAGAAQPGQRNPPRAVRCGIVRRVPRDLLARVPASELPAIGELIARHAARDPAPDRARRIALIGLRGAGKSTLGRGSPQHLGCPFIELNRVVEQDYGASFRT